VDPWARFYPAAGLYRNQHPNTSRGKNENAPYNHSCHCWHRFACLYPDAIIDPKLRQAVETIDKKFVNAQDKGDAAALAAVFSDDAVMVTNTGPLNGRKAIEEYYANALKATQFSNTTSTIDPDSPRSISATAMWVTGSWSTIAKGANWGAVEIKGFWGSIKILEAGTWKILTETWNITPPPAAAAAPSPTTTPSSQ
jgi:uncharacterized protein (TIGR02246 family)